MKRAQMIFTGYAYKYSNILYNHPPTAHGNFQTLSWEQVEKYKKLLGDGLPQYPMEWIEFDAVTGELLK